MPMSDDTARRRDFMCAGLQAWAVENDKTFAGVTINNGTVSLPDAKRFYEWLGRFLGEQR